MTLVDAAKTAATHLTSVGPERPVELVCARTGDALAAACVLAQALLRSGRSFHARFADDADLVLESDLEPDASDTRVFLDVGTGLLARVTQLPGRTLLVDTDAAHAPRIPRLNALRHGEKANTAGCATTAFALALALDERNWDLAPIALAGTLTLRPSVTQEGWDSRILDEATKRGHIRLEPALAFSDLPLLDLLALPDERVAVADGYDAAQGFLARNGLPPDASAHELGPRDRQTLASALALAHLKSSKPAGDLVRLIEPAPFSVAHQLPIARLASLLSAAARTDEGGLALAWILGDTTARPDLEAAETRARSRLRDSLRNLPPKIASPHVRQVEVGHPLDADAVARIVQRGWPDPERLTIVRASAGERLRFVVSGPSARTPHVLTAIQSLGGHAQGHDGHLHAWIPANREAELPRRLEASEVTA